MSEMFSIELKFISDCLYKYFITNIKILHLKIPDLEKMIYEGRNPIDSKRGKMPNLRFSTKSSNSKCSTAK